MLHVKIVGIISGSGFSDGKRRVELLVECGEAMYNRIRIPEEMLLTPATLDAKLEFRIVHAEQETTMPTVPTTTTGGTAKKASH